MRLLFGRSSSPQANGDSQPQAAAAQLTGHSAFRDFVLVSGQLLLLALSMLLISIWVAAFCSPAKAATITINSANEAWPELFILGAVLPVIVLSAISALRSFSRVDSLPQTGTKGKGREAP